MAEKLTTAGMLMVNQILPPELRSDSTRIDKKSISKIMEQVAINYPDKYSEILQSLTKLGAKVAHDTGSSVSAMVIANTKERQALADELDDAVQELRQTVKDPKEFEQRVVVLASKYHDQFKKLALDSGLALGDPMADQVASGARGNPVQYSSIKGADVLVTDHNGRPVPLPITRNYTMGLSPAQYFASLYGTRKGLIDTKMCKPFGTKVLLPDMSYAEIQDIRPGSYVMGADASGKLLPVRVLNLFDNGLQDCFKYTFRRFSSREETIEFEATENHKILSEIRSANSYKNDYTPKKRKLEEAREFSDPRKNEFYATAANGAHDSVLGKDEPLALLVGLMLGDGCTRGSQYRLSCADPSLVEHITSYMEALGLVIKKSSGYDWVIKSAACTKPLVSRDTTSGRVLGTSTTDSLKLRFSELGLHDKLAHEKTLPAEIFTSWSLKSVRDLISGLISTDGCVHDRKENGISIRLCLTSKAVIEDIYKLLNFKLGIGTSKISHIKASNKVFAKNDQYCISINYLDYIKEFARTIKLVGKKQKQLETALANNVFKDRKPGHKFLSKVPTGIKQTFDLEVDHPDHLYVLFNGIITSNSVGDAGYLAKRLVNSLHRLVVTDEKPIQYRLPTGLPVDAKDQSIIGSTLAQDVNQFPAGTVITPKIQQDLAASKTRILVYSPITSMTEGGGVDRLSSGMRERGSLSMIGDNVGVSAAQAISEPISQGLLDCLAFDTEVRMADFSTRRIADIKPGDLVLGADLEGNTFPVKVNHVFDQGLQPVNRYKIREGYSAKFTYVDCTTEHKFLANTKKTSCTDSKFNNSLRVIPISTKAQTYSVIGQGVFDDTATSFVNEPKAMLLGLLLGDGYTKDSGNGSFITCADPVQVEAMSSYIESLGFSLTKTSIPIQFRIADPEANNNNQRDSAGKFSSMEKNRVKSWLKSLGLWNLYCNEKFIPDLVHTWANRSVAELLSGLFVTDGCIYSAGGSVGITFASTSLSLALAVKFLLQQRFGIRSCISSTKSGRKLELYNIHINDSLAVDAFAKHIPLIGVKKDRLKTMLALRKVNIRNKFRINPRQSFEPLGLVHCFDLEVDHPAHLFVLANSLVCSNSKHSAGVGSRKVALGGYEYINNLIEAPEAFQQTGPLARQDGHVDKVVPAPQGGNYVYINGEEHFVPVQHSVLVKPGQQVEAGDDLSDGIPHPEELVRLRGLGEARRNYYSIFKAALDNSGIATSPRNIEMAVTGLMNHAQVSDPYGMGDYIPDDVINYSRVFAKYKPRAGHEIKPIKASYGNFLEEPALHYTIGTRINSKVQRDLDEFGVKDITVHKDPPQFTPFMQRSLLAIDGDEDWQTRLGGFYTARGFLDSVSRGALSERHSTSYVPAVANPVEIGKNLKTTGRY